MKTIIVILIGALVGLSTLSVATQFIAETFDYQTALGRPLFGDGSGGFYAPWMVLDWTDRWAEGYPRPFAVARLIVFGGFIAAIIIVAAAFKSSTTLPPFGRDGWAKFEDVLGAGLFAKSGTVLGKFQDEILVFDGAEHQLLIGASRSGKGRGHVVPTLLAWPHSMIVLDVKGELDRGDPRLGFPGTSGARATLGPVLRFAPTEKDSNCFNPLLEVRRGENEVRDVQNIAEIIVGFGDRSSEQFWNNSAKIVITGVVLHVLYSEPLKRKSLAVVREKLRDLDQTALEMCSTLHRLSPGTNLPQVHPEIFHAASSYLGCEERLRSSIKATAESFFGLFADPIVREKTSTSDFRLGDLMCADKPVTLFLQPPPSDAQRLMPLMRLLINQTARSLMEDQGRDAAGRMKKHKLLLLLDEFPQLGRLDFFEKMMGAMAGYGLKAYLVCQSLNHITKAYTRDNVIIDNCGVVTAFAAADPETANRIAEMAGEVWEMRPQESEERPRSVLGPRKGSVTYREERRPLLLAADVRKLPRDEQLIFVSGLKPLRAKKLRFDAERIFVKRLREPAPVHESINQTHDWIGVAPLGSIPIDFEKKSGKGQGRSQAKGSGEKGGSQVDLFGEAEAAPPVSPTPTGPKISDIALAGFRAPASDDTPPASEESDAETPPTRRHGTGV